MKRGTKRRGVRKLTPPRTLVPFMRPGSLISYRDGRRRFKAEIKEITPMKQSKYMLMSVVMPLEGPNKGKLTSIGLDNPKRKLKIIKKSTSIQYPVPNVY